nr:MAG TPA: hypothetical protein [Caudoviricetes sp.]
MPRWGSALRLNDIYFSIQGFSYSVEDIYSN